MALEWRLRLAQEIRVHRCRRFFLVDRNGVERFQTCVRLLRQHFDLVQRIGEFVLERRDLHRCICMSQRVAEVLQAFFGHIQNQIALGAAILGQSLEVILDAGDRVSQGIQALPVRHSLSRQKLILDVAIAGLQQGRSTLQGNHRQTAANLSEQIRHPGQMLVVPLRGNEFDDCVLGLLQPVTRFANDQLVNLGNIGGRQVACFAALLRGTADHAGQRSLDIEQRTGDIHQDGVVGRLLPLRYGLDEDDLIENDLARLSEAEHCQGIGDLLERDLKAGQLGNDLAIAAHEQVQAVLYPHQLFTKGSDHRAHRATVGTSQLSTLLIDHGAVRQRFVEAVKLL